MLETEKYFIYFHRHFDYVRISKFKEPVLRVAILCNFIDKTGSLIGSGMAILNPRDKYDKILGRKIAFSRAIEKTNLDKPERTALWADFWGWVNNWGTI